jgi:hypothetical protein
MKVDLNMLMLMVKCQVQIAKFDVCVLFCFGLIIVKKEKTANNEFVTIQIFAMWCT